MKTVREVLTASRAYLEKQGVSLPRRSLEEAIGHILKVDRLGLYVDFDRPLEEDELQREREVVLKHAIKGAIIPVVSFLGPAASGIVMGSFVVETLFGIPGLGRWFVNGAVNRDYYVVLGTVILESGIVILFNLLVDLSLPWLDPRLKGKA